MPTPLAVGSYLFHIIQLDLYDTSISKCNSSSSIVFCYLVSCC